MTVDQNLIAQQNTANLSFGVVLLKANSNNLPDLRSLVPMLLATLAKLSPGDVVVVSNT